MVLLIRVVPMRMIGSPALIAIMVLANKQIGWDPKLVIYFVIKGIDGPNQSLRLIARLLQMSAQWTMTEIFKRVRQEIQNISRPLTGFSCVDIAFPDFAAWTGFGCCAPFESCT